MSRDFCATIEIESAVIMLSFFISQTISMMVVWFGFLPSIYQLPLAFGLQVPLYFISWDLIDRLIWGGETHADGSVQRELQKVSP
jgi:hypothetical protein